MIVDCFDSLLNVFYAFNKIYKITTVQKEFDTEFLKIDLNPILIIGLLSIIKIFNFFNYLI